MPEHTATTARRSAAPTIGTPPDHRLSPRTGWTRGHWNELADRTLRAVRPYASPRHALLDLPGRASHSGPLSDGLEGFARTMLTAGFRIAGDLGSAAATEHAEWYARGLVAGTDPGSGESWPSLHDVHQARVEAACIAIALHESRDLIWANLDGAEQQRVVDWLSGAVGVTYPANNWVWFQNVVHAFLASVGAPTERADVERNLALVEEWYSGNGWYADGAFPGGEHRSYDYYSGWAMQVYPLWYSRILGPLADPVRVQTDRDRLRAYLEQAQHLIGSDGAPVHHGRSLTYRFAVLGPFWAGALFDATPLSPGRTRRLASGTLRHFAERGAWNSDGLQPIGWYDEFAPIRQFYSGPGSPYWSGKGFAGLALPADHPVWTDVEEPLAVEQGDVAQSWSTPGWLLSATQADGVVRLLNHGADHQPSDTLGIDDALYGRVGYSTVGAPDTGVEAETSPVDSCVVLVDATGRASHRRPVQRVSQDEHSAVSRHRAHWLIGPSRDGWQRWTDRRPDTFDLGPWVSVASVLRGAVEVRLVRVDPDPGPPTDGAVATGPWHLRIGGYAVAAAEPPRAVEPVVTAPGEVVAVGTDRPLVSSMVGLIGDWVPGVHRAEGRNAFGRYTAVPLLTSARPVVVGEVAAVAVVLSGDGDAVPDLPVVDAAGCSATVTWPGGQVDRVRLAPASQRRGGDAT